MERIGLYIESTNVLLRCMLNPEDRDNGFVIQRSSGLGREDAGALAGSDLTDNPVIARNRGDTRMTLKLMFDVELSRRRPRPVDVRELTLHLWQLTEYAAKGRERSRDLPRVRLFWGRGWEIPVLVESVAERYERFNQDALPGRSWITLGLLRVTEEIPPPVKPGVYPPLNTPSSNDLPQDDPNWGVHEVVVGGVQGESLWGLANKYYGDPRLWRFIATANEIDDPMKVPAGKLLRIPPLKFLRNR